MAARNVALWAALACVLSWASGTTAVCTGGSGTICSCGGFTLLEYGPNGTFVTTQAALPNGDYVPGQTYAFKDPLFLLPSPETTVLPDNAVAVGNTFGSCVVWSTLGSKPWSGDVYCSYSFILTDVPAAGRNSTISVQGQFYDYENTPSTFTITGGTGAFAGVSGQAATTTLSRGANWRYTFLYSNGFQPAC